MKQFFLSSSNTNKTFQYYYIMNFDKYTGKIKGNGLKANVLQSFLSNSYKKNADQKMDGYTRDDSLSGRRAQVYKNDANQAVVVHRGTASAKDWAVDALSAVGMHKSTNRYKHAKKIQKQAESKYGANNTKTLGHSLGARLAEDVGGKSNEIITYNKPVVLTNIGKKVSNKNTDIRTNNDPVSFLHHTQKNKGRIKTIQSGTFNPISAHGTDKLGVLGDSYIGNGIKKTSPWIQHIKNYAVEHEVSYKEAMKLAASSYKK
jgi:hypothetical protein